MQATSVGKNTMTATSVTVPVAPRPSNSTISGAVVTMGTERSAIASGIAVPATAGARMKQDGQPRACGQPREIAGQQEHGGFRPAPQPASRAWRRRSGPVSAHGPHRPAPLRRRG